MWKQKLSLIIILESNKKYKSQSNTVGQNFVLRQLPIAGLQCLEALFSAQKLSFLPVLRFSSLSYPFAVCLEAKCLNQKIPTYCQCLDASSPPPLLYLKRGSSLEIPRCQQHSQVLSIYFLILSVFHGLAVVDSSTFTISKPLLLCPLVKSKQGKNKTKVFFLLLIGHALLLLTAIQPPCCCPLLINISGNGSQTSLNHQWCSLSRLFSTLWTLISQILDLPTGAELLLSYLSVTLSMSHEGTQYHLTLLHI